MSTLTRYPDGNTYLAPDDSEPRATALARDPDPVSDPHSDLPDERPDGCQAYIWGTLTAGCSDKPYPDPPVIPRSEIRHHHAEDNHSLCDYLVAGAIIALVVVYKIVAWLPVKAWQYWTGHHPRP